MKTFSQKSVRTLAVSLALAVPASVVVPLVAPVAVQAMDNDQDNLSRIYINPSDTAQAWGSEFRKFQMVALARETYDRGFSAKAWEVDNRDPDFQRDIAQSNRQTEIAFAREAIALLQYEGNPEAQAIETTKIGHDLLASKLALDLMNTERKSSQSLAESAADDDPQKAAKQRRDFIFNYGSSRLEKEIALLENGDSNPQEVPFGVIDWGLEEKYLDAAAEKMNTPEPALGLYVTGADAANKVDVEQLKKDATYNLKSLTLDTVVPPKADPEDPKPAPEDPKDPKPAPEDPKDPKDPKDPDDKDDSNDSDKDGSSESDKTTATIVGSVLGVLSLLGLLAAALLGPLKPLLGRVLPRF
ncbi:hypothetical protein CPHO_11995 [Corynebacterium phocae]|uniref:Uncharacterized protein n=1 Tax=Corynebacterium phocae TaxID=161895 RepID=A0A1L7D6C1_9CORY|nr:hypothetical protein [Corynebacterium phocae]APT93492.1 hypothetical protein CPHO_11995 [Corynebacterium phocae]KAA8720572.1 hypothetical protein F4V58_11445 [Corynebacterium phocae]